MRETLEETGFAAELLAVGIPTLATWPTRVGAEDVDNLGGEGLVSEPIAVTQRMTDGKLKIIFWFAAQVDSTLWQREGTQQEGEDSETVWVSIGKVAEVLTVDDDRQVAAEVLAAIQACSTVLCLLTFHKVLITKLVRFKDEDSDVQ